MIDRRTRPTMYASRSNTRRFSCESQVQTRGGIYPQGLVFPHLPVAAPRAAVCISDLSSLYTGRAMP